MVLYYIITLSLPLLPLPPTRLRSLRANLRGGPTCPGRGYHRGGLFRAGECARTSPRHERGWPYRVHPGPLLLHWSRGGYYHRRTQGMLKQPSVPSSSPSALIISGLTIAILCSSNSATKTRSEVRFAGLPGPHHARRASFQTCHRSALQWMGRSDELFWLSVEE